MVLQRDGRGHDPGAQRGQCLFLIPDGAAFRRVLRAEARCQYRRMIIMILRHQRPGHIDRQGYTAGALRVQAQGRPACLSSARRRITGSSFPRFEARRRIPAQAFGLK